MAQRDPHSVPVEVIARTEDIARLGRTLAGADRVAIDTEVPIAGRGAGLLRVMSVATRSRDGAEHAFVVDARDLDPRRLAPLLDGVVADAWNASFDARVLDAAVWDTDDTTQTLRWWDAQLADALLYQGRSGFNWYHGLAWAVERYLGFEAMGKGTTQLSYTATDDLDDDQIAYAAADAVETLWVGDALRVRIESAGLQTVCAIEMAARPFLDRMQRSGLPFDWQGWRAELDRVRADHRACVDRLAALTGGGQGNLFDDVTEPSWNPDSDVQVREVLNQWSQPEVWAFTASRYGQARSFGDGDSMRAGVLREVGGELAQTVLDYRSHAKILSTYGESIGEHIDDDGRMRPQYLQVVGTNTGRLASRNPNAQNFTPRMKPFFRPPDPGRVFVHADLSQAELRFLAQVADDPALRDAFAQGDDIHVRTAASMFGFDPVELARTGPDRLADMRQKAKAINFGIAYGTGAASLGRQLTAGGSETTTAQAKVLLDQYRAAYPGTAQWARDRIAEIDATAARTATIDWDTTRRLARLWPPIAETRRGLRRESGRWPSAAEVHERLDERHGIDLGQVKWALGYSAPVALVAGGQAFTFASRTLSGRRQQFNLHSDRLYLSTVIAAASSTVPVVVDARDRFGAESRLDLEWSASNEQRVRRLFEDRALRRSFVESLVDQAGPEAVNPLLAQAARERVRATVNAWRNAPIQGGVADIMLEAYGLLDQALARFESARPVQTVHDSIVVECDRDHAPGVALVVAECLEAASRRFCPDVVPKADVDIRTSLAGSDIVEIL